MPTYYFTNNAYQSAWSTANSTTALNDGSPGDTSTFIGPSSFANPASQTAFYDFGVNGTISANQFTFILSVGSTTPVGSWILEGSTNSTVWSTITSGALPFTAGSATVSSPSISGTYRYYRLSIKSGTLDIIALSDWRPTVIVAIVQLSVSVKGSVSITGTPTDIMMILNPVTGALSLIGNIPNYNLILNQIANGELAVNGTPQVVYILYNPVLGSISINGTPQSIYICNFPILGNISINGTPTLIDIICEQLLGNISIVGNPIDINMICEQLLGNISISGNPTPINILNESVYGSIIIGSYSTYTTGSFSKIYIM